MSVCRGLSGGFGGIDFVGDLFEFGVDLREGLIVGVVLWGVRQDVGYQEDVARDALNWHDQIT